MQQTFDYHATPRPHKAASPMATAPTLRNAGAPPHLCGRLPVHQALAVKQEPAASRGESNIGAAFGGAVGEARAARRAARATGAARARRPATRPARRAEARGRGLT
jgi:hypothetical protein